MDLKAEIKKVGFEACRKMLEEAGSVGRIMGSYYRCKVPWREDKHPSLDVVVNGADGIEAGFWIDRSQNTHGDVFDLYARLNGLNAKEDFPQILEGLARMMGVPFPRRECRIANSELRIDGKEQKERGKSSEGAMVDGEFIPEESADFAELLRHYGLTIEDYIDCECRFRNVRFDGPAEPAILYPIVTASGKNGTKVKSVRRDASGKRKCKHLSRCGAGFFPTGTVKKRVKGPLVLTGGEEKSIACRVDGYRAVSTSNGENLSNSLLRLLLGKDRPAKENDIIVAFDADETGRTQTEAVVSRLMREGVERVRRVVWPPEAPEGYDINDAFQHGILHRLIDESEECERQVNWWMLRDESTGPLYETDNSGAIYLVKETRNGEERIQLTECVCRIVEEKRGAGPNGESELLVEIRARGETKSFQMSSKEWMNDARLKELICQNLFGPYMDSRRACEAIRVLSCVARAEDPPKTLETCKAGFQASEQEYRLAGLVVEGGKVRKPDGQESRICERGWGMQGVETLEAFVEREGETLEGMFGQVGYCWPEFFSDKVKASVVLSVGLFGPLVVPAIGQRQNMVMGLIGNTSTGKTSVARLLAGMWGNQDGRIWQHGTWKSAAQMAVEHRHGLCVLDDIRGGAGLDELVSLAYDGGVRARLARSGELLDVPAPESMCLITGESFEGAQQSSINRMVIVDFEKVEDEDRLPAIQESMEMMRGMKQPSAMSVEAIRMVQNVGRDDLLEKFDELQHVVRGIPGSSARVREVAARAGLCVWLLRRLVGLYSSAESEFAWLCDEDAALRYVLEAQKKKEASFNESTIFITRLQELIAQGEAMIAVKGRWVTRQKVQIEQPGRHQALQVRYFIIEPDICNPRINERVYAINPGPTLRLMSDLSLKQQSLSSKLRDNGDVITMDAGNTPSALITIANETESIVRSRFWLIPERILMNADNEDAA